MKIDKLQVLNFQGLKGNREYNFNNKVYALCQNNGSGKTSFINALRYGLSGTKPSGSVFSDDEKTFAVGLTVEEDGFIRQEFSDKSPKYYFNKKSFSKKDFEKELSAYTGCSSNDIKIATSSDVVAMLKPQEFGELILSYIPEQLTVEKVIGYLDDAPESVKEFINVNLPDTAFGTDELVSVYNMAVESRKEVKRKISEIAGMMKGLGTIERTGKSSSEYQSMRKDLENEQTEIIEKIKLKMSYEKAKAQYDEQNKAIIEAENRLKGINVPEKVPNREEICAKIADCRKKLENASVVMATLKQNLILFEKSLIDIDKPVCPLSDKLKCTTDKSVVRNDLEKAVADTKKAITAQQDGYNTASEMLNAFLKELNETDDIILKIKEREQLTSNIRKMKSQMPILPAEPGRVENAKNVVDRLNELLTLQKQAEKFEEYGRLKDEYDRLCLQLEDLEYIVAAFSPKGKIKEKVVGYYISSFEEECNKKAAMLRDGFRVKFVSNNGITVHSDINGDGHYRTFNQLSGGEKVFCLFVLLDMLCNLTGLRIMIFDELSVLDKKAFEALIHLIKENEDDYDMVIISAAEHDDIKECLIKEGISILTV